jgi:hypothetical protein
MASVSRRTGPPGSRYPRCAQAVLLPAMDQKIAAVAKGIVEYLGEETWENTTTRLVSNVYYRDSLEALQQLVSHPRHVEAKSAQDHWLSGYQVVVSQVLRTYGDTRLAHLLPIAATAPSG